MLNGFYSRRRVPSGGIVSQEPLPRAVLMRIGLPRRSEAGGPRGVTNVPLVASVCSLGWELGVCGWSPRPSEGHSALHPGFAAWLPAESGTRISCPAFEGRERAAMLQPCAGYSVK